MRNEISTLGVTKKIIIILIFSFILVSCWNTWNIQKNEITKNTNMEEQSFTEQYFAQIWVSEFKKEIENDEVILLDVRTPWELPVYWKIRENQLLIDINQDNFAFEISKLDKSKKYAVYCWHGNRSVVARNYMKEQWFSYVKDLAWWIEDWVLEWESVLK